MSTPTISYRALDANGDPRFGQGQADFLTGLQAVAQAILTRLRLMLGEWYQDTSDGLPVWQNLLGTSSPAKNLAVNATLIVSRILGTPYVTSVSNVQSGYNSSTRTMTFSCRVQTQFGELIVSNAPQVPSRALPTFGG